jgi:hypothetical protein
MLTSDPRRKIILEQFLPSPLPSPTANWPFSLSLSATTLNKSSLIPNSVFYMMRYPFYQPSKQIAGRQSDDKVGAGGDFLVNYAFDSL